LKIFVNIEELTEFENIRLQLPAFFANNIWRIARIQRSQPIKIPENHKRGISFSTL
jgi:hypothetical protein